jgi:uncharacterized membrane protein YfcA
MIWTTVNTVVISYRFFFAHMYTETVMSTFLFSLPFLTVGFLLGMWIHNKVRNETFHKLVYFILLLGGAVSLYCGAAAMI